MAEAVNYRATQVERTALGKASQMREDPTANRDFTVDTGERAADAAAALFMNETVIGNTIDWVGERRAGRGAADPTFNPYQYYLDNQEEIDKENPAFRQFLGQGDFHHTKSENEFNAARASLKTELDRRERIANGGAWGMAVGGALVFADVSTLVPFVGMGKKLGTVGKIGVMAANAAGQQAAQEVFLQSRQYARTAEESIMTIGLATAMGGGLGTFAAYVGRKNSLLHPAHPQNPMRIGGDTAMVTIDSVGAAASSDVAVNYADSTGIGLFDRIGRALKTPTSVARSVAEVDPESAAVIENLSRTGIVTKGNEQGVADFATDAEGIWHVDYETAFIANTQDMDDIFVQMNIDLQGQGSKASVNARAAVEHIPGASNLVRPNAVTVDDWNRHIVQSLNDPQYSAGNPVIDKALKDATDKSKKFFDKMFDRGVALGLFTPEQKLDNYFVQRWVAPKINNNPQEFESFLMNEFMKTPDDDWLLDSYQMTKAEFDKLPETLAGLTDTYKGADGKNIEVPAGTKPAGNATPVKINRTKREVLTAWEEENISERMVMLQKQADVAQAAAEDAEYRFRFLFRETRRLEKGEGEAKLMEAKAIVREKEAELQQMRNEKAQLEEERRLLALMSQRAQRTTQDRLAQEGADATKVDALEESLGLRPVGREKPEGLSAAAIDIEGRIFTGKSHTDAMESAIKEGVPEDVVEQHMLAGRFGYETQSGRFVSEQDAIPIAHHAGQMKGETLTSDTIAAAGGFRKKYGGPSPSEVAKRIETRAMTQKQALDRLDRRIAKGEQRLDALAQATAERIQAASHAKMARKAAAAQLKVAKSGKKFAEAEARKATRKLTAASKRKPVSEQAKEITRILQNRGESPNGTLLFKQGSEEHIAESGRVKHRGINLSPAALKHAIDQGWLDTNVNNIMNAYTRDVGGRLALLEKFGSVDLKPQIAAIQDRFATLKGRATSEKERAMLAAQEKDLINVVTTLRNRVLGIDGLPDDPESFLVYMSRSMRQVNYLRMMGGTMLSSVTDIATSALSNGGMGKTLKMFATGAARGLKKHASQLPDRELQALLFGSENSMLFSRAAKNMGVDDLQWIRGYGAGNTRKATAAVEGALRWGQEKMSLINGQTWWNSRLRYTAGQLQLANIVDDTETLLKGGKLPEHRVTEYARFGMTTDDLKEIGTLIKTHGDRNSAGLYDPNAKAWPGERGDAMRRKMLILLKRATQEAVIAPTMTDIPPFMSKTAGRVLLQFQTFGFAAVNKYVRNLRYKAVNGQSFDALMSVTWALMMGATAYVLKEGVVKGNELSDKPAQWVYEGVDRSGLVGYLSPLANAGLKLGAPALNKMGIDWLEQPSRYRSASWGAALLGPSAGLLEDGQGLFSAFANGDTEQMTNKSMKLVPFRNVFYIEWLWRNANGLHD